MSVNRLEYFQNIKSSYVWVEGLKVIYIFSSHFSILKKFCFYFVNVILISSLQINIFK